MSAAESVSSAMWRSFGCCAAQRRDFSCSSRVRTVPSMTVSPTVATRPPSTLGSTTTFRLTLLAGGVGERRRADGPAGRAVSATALRTSATLRSLRRRGALHERSMIAGRSRARPRRPPSTRAATSSASPCRRADPRRSPAARGRDQLVGERVAQLARWSRRAGEAEQLVLDLVERSLGAGDLEQARA